MSRRLEGIAERKAVRQKIEAPRDREPSKVVDLMDALRRSVQTERAGGERRKPAPRAGDHRAIPVQTCVFSLCVIVSWQAGAMAKEEPRFEAGLRRVWRGLSFRRLDNPRKPLRFRLKAAS